MMEIGPNQILARISSSSIANLGKVNSSQPAEKSAASAQNLPPIAEIQPISAISGAFNSLVNPASLIEAQFFAQAESTADTNDKAVDSKKSATELFLEYANMTPAERAKLLKLKQLGLTEEEFDALPPEEKQKIVDEIAEMVKAEAERIKTQAVDQA